ncbi:lysozyme [Paraburkholderia atlantica]|uniref:lysozyme n=1 Tax=Paraburkholderia atlantica TaxID=2654982 RepID=UPI00181A8E75|nr:lysozyme [Paraburkholderia atlantica]MBB5509550.1 lysozyme [Paraburkholderia atlantica]
MDYSKDGLHLTEYFEGGPFLTAYKPLPTDNWTIGYGHTIGVHEGMTCTAEEADQWLQEDVKWAANAVNLYVKPGITQDEFDALVDFTFNVGITAFKNSTMLAKLNDNDVQGAIDEFEKWDMSGGQHVAGLLRRRNAERALFTLGADFSKEAEPQPESAQ